VPDQLNKIICETVNKAINIKSNDFKRDVTYVCTVEEEYLNNRYRLKHNNTIYFVTLSNIKPNIHEKVRLILPQGNLKDKYVLEDVIGKYSVEIPESGFSGDYNDLHNKPTSLPANGGDSKTVNGHTVETDVPADAVFTDTVYEHPKTNIPNGEYNYVTVNEFGHVTNARNISAGSAVQPVYFNNNGIPVACDYTFNQKADYEEGIWTPVLKAYNNSNISNLSASNGYYVKTGNTVWVSFILVCGGVSPVPAFQLSNNSLPYNYDSSISIGRRNLEIIEIDTTGGMVFDAMKQMSDIRFTELTYSNNSSLNDYYNGVLRISFEYNIKN